MRMTAPPMAIPAIAPVDIRWETEGALKPGGSIATMYGLAPAFQLH